MSKKQNPRRSADEWMQLIQECRSSGLSDADWCNQQGIPSSTFYTAVKRCRERACIIPENTAPVSCEKQEVSNNCEKSTITNTLLALRELC